VGNWGDDERTAELHEFLLDPVQQLGLRARVHGVRYPGMRWRRCDAAGLSMPAGCRTMPCQRPSLSFRVTVHVLRRPYVQALPGIPTIRVS
jgi:hypothetical protein